MSENHFDEASSGDENSPAATPLKSGAISLHRRRFTVAGIAASSAILTLASRPVLGAVDCPVRGKALSAWVSGNNGHCASQAFGESPGHWKNVAPQWPGKIDCNATFVSLFPYCKGTSLAVPVEMKDGATLVATLLDVISAETYNDVFARSITCAYLNALNGSPVPPTLGQIKDMAALQFRPGPSGPFWSKTEILVFLSQTFR